jgi:threonine dehydratase
MQPPVFDDILAACPRVYAHMRPSALLNHPLVDQWIGCRVWIKHENHNPTGAFKIRGGLNLVAQLAPEERRRGIIAASTGNHGQSLALACRLHGVPCRIAVPIGNNPSKTAAMRAYGAEVTELGRDFDDTRQQVERMAADEGLRYVHTANEPALIAGVGTYALEIFDDLPEADAIFVPVGGGSGACGCVLVRTGRGARTRVIGVQATGADAFARSWRGPERVTRDRIDTIAEGIATRITYDLTFGILKNQLDDVVEVTDDEMQDAMAASVTRAHTLIESASAASLAAARKSRLPPSANVVCVVSGGNVDVRGLMAVLARAGTAGN